MISDLCFLTLLIFFIFLFLLRKFLKKPIDIDLEREKREEKTYIKANSSRIYSLKKEKITFVLSGFLVVSLIAGWFFGWFWGIGIAIYAVMREYRRTFVLKEKID